MKKHQTLWRSMLVLALALSGLIHAGCDDNLTGNEEGASYDAEDARQHDGVEGENDVADHGLEDDTTASYKTEAAEIEAFNLEFSQASSTSPLDLINPAVGPNLDEMAQYVEQTLTGKAVGFAYAITQNGQLKKAKGKGWARTPADGGKAMLTSTRLNVASVTKPITAVATLQLLEQLGLSIDSKIWPWLPAGWVKGPGINSLTFRHLLTHTSGSYQKFMSLSQAEKDKWGNDWEGIRYVVSIGMQPGSPKKYKNWNFAVLRVIIPKLWKATGTDPGINQITSVSHGFWYVAYVQQRIFEPSGVSGVICQPQASYPSALAYNVGNVGIGGVMSSQALANCGGHNGLHLSANALARFMVHIRYNNNVLSPAMRQLMDSLKLGWWGSSGGMRWHSGKLYLGGGREINTCVMKYPNNVEATLVINSSETATGTTCGIIKTAYEKALP